jgi:hypothetical protein
MDDDAWNSLLQEIDGCYDEKPEDVATKPKTPPPPPMSTSTAPWVTILCCDRLKQQPADPKVKSLPPTPQSEKHIEFLIAQGSQIPKQENPTLRLTRKNYHQGFLSVMRTGEILDSQWPLKYFAAWAKEDNTLGGFIEIDESKVKAAQGVTVRNLLLPKVERYLGECPQHPNLEYYVRYHPFLSETPAKRQRATSSVGIVNENNENLEEQEAARLARQDAELLGLWYYAKEDQAAGFETKDEALAALSFLDEGGDESGDKGSDEGGDKGKELAGKSKTDQEGRDNPESGKGLSSMSCSSKKTSNEEYKADRDTRRA